MGRGGRVGWLSLLCMTSMACQERIQHGLEEREAHALLTLLGTHAIEARKVAEGGKQARWSLEVRSTDAPHAIRLLTELALPRVEPMEGCNGMGGSFVRTPAEEQLCRMQTLERGLERTLQSVSGVLSARVHLVMPVSIRYGQLPAPSKASVLLRFQPGRARKDPASKDALRLLVAGAVEGLKASDVALLVEDVVVPSPERMRPAAQLPGLLRFLLAGLGLLLSALSAGLFWKVLRGRRERERQELTALQAPQPLPVTPELA